MANRFLSNIRINDAYTLPASDGSSGQVISTDGAGNLSFVDQTGGASTTALSLNVTVKNVSGGSLAKGTIVHAHPSATPPSGNIVEVVAADYDDTAYMPAIGVLNETLANEAEGDAIMFGAVSGIDTSIFSAGDELWVGNNGAFTNTKPATAGQLIQKIAVVIKSHATNGLIKVFGAGRTNDVPLPLYIDNTNQRVGIGISTPAVPLHVNGWARLNGSLQLDGNNRQVMAIDNTSLLFGTDNTVRMTINNIGNVGIGDTNPSQVLSVNGAMSAHLFYDYNDTSYFVNPNSTTTSANFAGKVQASQVGVTNIVTNKVVKFNGSILDDSNITDTGSLITLGSQATVSGDVTINPSTNYALYIGRIGGQPNIKSSDAYAFMDSNGGHAGLNWYTSDNVALANGGGSVSIGNAGVSQKLTVWGSVGATIYYDKDDTNYYVNPNGTSNLERLQIRPATNGIGANINFSDQSVGSQQGNLTYFHADGASYGSGNAFVFSSTEANMTVLADGKLMFKEGLYLKPSSGTGAGIEVISSTRSAEFADSVKITNTGGAQRLLLGNQDSSGVNNPAIISAANGNTYIGGGNTWSGNGGTMDYTAIFTDGGDVGIGTNSPIGKLNVVQSTLDLPSVFLSRYNSEDEPILQIGEATHFSGSSTYGEALIHSFNRDIVFSTEVQAVLANVTGTPRLIIEKNNGNVGVNIGSPTYTLDVNGTLGVRAGTIQTNASTTSFNFLAGSAAKGAKVGFLLASNSYSTTPASGVIEAQTDMRAPIYYDANNTGYYVNPQGTSKVAILLVEDQIRTGNGQQLVLNAGESYVYATGQTGENVYVNAENGLQVNSSPDNWGSGWAGRYTATICDAAGNSYFPGRVQASELYTSGKVIHTGDTDTYTEFNAADTWRVVVGGSQKLVVNSSSVSVSNATLSHQGVTLSSGDNIDQIHTFDMSFTLTALTWTDTGISYTDLPTGTYTVQVYVDDHNAGGQHYDEYYSGTMSWYAGSTNSTNSDEIVLHNAGHASGSSYIQLRTERHTSANGTHLMLQVKQNFNHSTALDGTNGKTMTFKFRRLL